MCTGTKATGYLPLPLLRKKRGRGIINISFIQGRCIQSIMRNLFNYDGGFFRAMDKLGSLFLLNLLTLICMLPVITAGASITALYYVTMKMVKDEETYIAKDFFRSFRQNFRQATIIWLIYLVLGVLLYLDYRIVSLNRDTFPAAGVFIGLTTMFAVFYAMSISYVFPILAKFYNSVKQTIKNSMLMSIRHFPKTVAILFILTVFPVVILVGLYRNGQSLLAPLYICLGLSVPAYANSYLFHGIFRQYIPEEEGAKPGSDEAFFMRRDEEDADGIGADETGVPEDSGTDGSRGGS